MSEAVFPLHVSQALDRLTVPELPAGFADRLAARVESGDLPEDAGVVHIELPTMRRSIGATGWRRSGRILVVSASLGLATATAAAAGVFGDAVYIPVMSDVLARAQIVPMPQKEASRDTVFTPNPVTAKVDLPTIEPVATGKDLVVKLLTDIQHDHRLRNLTRQQRNKYLESELRPLIISGSVKREDIRQALLQLSSEREARGKALFRHDLPEIKKRHAEMLQSAAKLDPDVVSPAHRQKLSEAYKQLNVDQQLEIRRLWQRRRDAEPEERRAIWTEIRDFWKRTGVDPGVHGPDSSDGKISDSELPNL